MLVDLKKKCPEIVFDIVYATEKNFMGEVLYETDDCFVHVDLYHELLKALSFLKQRGLGLKCFDGFRPLSVQEKMWNLLPDERYIGNPKKGGRHTRGTAIDVTLIDLKTGKELAMPTPFDTFSEMAHYSYQDLPKEVLENRALLATALCTHANFEPLPTEWWHFDLKGWENYPPLQIELSDVLAS